MKPESILLIGGSGQLGTALREVFHDVNVVAISHGRFTIGRYGDMVYFDEVVYNHKPSVVINCAAFHSVPGCEKNPSEAMSVNAIGVYEMAWNCNAAGIPFVHISTDYVYGGKHPAWKGECSSHVDVRVDPPLNVYGASKYAGEQLIHNFNKMLIVRTSGLYGRTGVSGKGPHFLERVLRAAESGQTFQAVDDVFFSPSYAPCVARGIRKLIEAGEYGIHHVAGVGCTSWYEFARYAHYVAFSGSPNTIGRLEPIKLASLNEPFERPMRVNLISDLKDMLSWEHGVRQYVNQRDWMK